MPGRPDFTTPGSGGGQRIAVNQAPRYEQITADTSVNVSGNGKTQQVAEIYAPEDSTYEVVSARLKAPPPTGATNGEHSLVIASAGFLKSVEGKSNYDNTLFWRQGGWTQADVQQLPGSEAAALQAMQSVVATENQPIRISYFNSTDVVQDQTLLLRFTVERRDF